ncbi:MAG: hypothetical protein ABI981_11375 [Betaproteobacteria bacterium]
MLVYVREMHQAGGLVEPKDAYASHSELMAQLVADEFDNSLEIQRGGHAVLDAVDYRQLGVARFGLLQQALRFVEQACVLECHAHAACQRLQQPHVRIREGMPAIHVGQLDHSTHLVARNQRNVNHRFR